MDDRRARRAVACCVLVLIRFYRTGTRRAHSRICSECSRTRRWSMEQNTEVTRGREFTGEATSSSPVPYPSIDPSGMNACVRASVYTSSPPITPFPFPPFMLHNFKLHPSASGVQWAQGGASGFGQKKQLICSSGIFGHKTLGKRKPHSVQRWTFLWTLGCEKFLPGLAWLLLSKTGPLFSSSL